MVATWTPMAGMAPSEAAEGREPEIIDPPQGASDLGQRIFSDGVASFSAAAELGVPGLGSGDAKKRNLLWVREEARWKVCRTSGGTKVRVGVAARQVVRISSTEASVKLSLPWLAASATLGQLEASQTVTVAGYVGDLPRDSRPKWSELGVESYQAALGRFEKLTDHVFKDTANFRPELLGEFTWSSSAEVGQAVGTLWAMMQIARRVNCIAAVERLPEAFRDSDDAQQAVKDAYRNAADQEGCNTEGPSQEASARAVAELRGIGLWNPR
jgi:hypothetical protein